MPAEVLAIENRHTQSIHFSHRGRRPRAVGSLHIFLQAGRRLERDLFQMAVPGGGGRGSSNDDNMREIFARCMPK